VRSAALPPNAIASRAQRIIFALYRVSYSSSGSATGVPTYDHLRDLFPDREIFAFDRQIGAHPSCVPKESHMILGDIFETLPAAPTWIGGQVALVHSDIGGGNLAETSAVCDALPEMLAPILASGAIVVSDQELRTPNWQKLPLPAAVAPGRYHMWRVAAQNDAEHWLP